MSGQPYANYPLLREEHRGVERARGIVGATMSHIRPELNRPPVNAEFSDTVHRTANYKIPNDMPDAVDVGQVMDKVLVPGGRDLLAVKNVETRFATGLPVFFDRAAYRVIESKKETPLVSLSGLNQKLAQICDSFAPGQEDAGLRALLKMAADRWVYVGPQLSYETEGSGRVRRMMAVGIDGLSFIGDMFRKCYDYFTPTQARAARLQQGIQVPAVGGSDSIPLEPYTQGHVLGLVWAITTKKWVTDPRVSARSLADVLSVGGLSPSDLCVQVFPWVSYSTQVPSASDIYGTANARVLQARWGVGGAELPVLYTRIGTVASTYLDGAMDGGVGFEHAAIFPGASPVRPTVTAEEPVRVYLERRGPRYALSLAASSSSSSSLGDADDAGVAFGGGAVASESEDEEA